MFFDCGRGKPSPCFEAMKMIVGLGNPGAEYAATRHNVGFMFADALFARTDAANWREKFGANVAEARADGEKIILVKPLTFMNESGRAVRPLLDWYKIAPEDMAVAHDDMDLPVGLMRLRPKGGSGGHNGIKSLLTHVGSENFARFRIGIGRPHEHRTTINHVLTTFDAEEAAKIKAAVDCLCDAALCFVKEGIDVTMNRYNPKKASRHETEQK